MEVDKRQARPQTGRCRQGSRLPSSDHNEERESG